MQVVLWDNFNKKQNSTKIPLIAGTPKDVYMKEATSIESPTFIVNSNNFNYTYAYWNGHYYFVNDIVSVKDNLIAISCSQDVLATYREEILDTTQYIARSASEYDGSIIDTFYSGLADIRKTEAQFETPFDVTGSYVLGVLSKSSSNATIGCVTYYVLSSSQLASFMNFMLGNIDYMEIDFDSLSEWTEQLFKGLVSPFQYIVSCMYFPFNVPSGASHNIEFGFWNSGVSANYLGASSWVTSVSAVIPKHNQSVTRGKYLNLSPYSKYMLNFRPFGNIPLDSASIINATSINMLIGVDLVTGEGTMRISDNSGNDIATLKTQVGVPVQLAQISSGLLGGNMANIATASIATAGIDAIIGGNINALNIGSSTSAWSPSVISGGSNGSRSEYRMGNPNIVGEFIQVATDNIDLNGRPLLQNRVLRNLSGYTQCVNPSIDINCLGNDRAEINSLLSSGFYIE